MIPAVSQPDESLASGSKAQKWALAPGGARAFGDHRSTAVTWIVLGLLAGFNTSKIVNKHGGRIDLDFVPGAVVGAWLFYSCRPTLAAC